MSERTGVKNLLIELFASVSSAETDGVPAPALEKADVPNTNTIHADLSNWSIFHFV